MHHNGLVEHPHPPLERGADVVIAVLELEPQHLTHRSAHHVVVAQPYQLPDAASTADHSRLLVADDEGGVRRGVVVVEQLEEEAVAAAGAAARLVAKPCGAV